MKIHFTLHLITCLPKGGWRFTIWKVKILGITNNTNTYYGAESWHFTGKFCTISISLGFVSSIFLKVVKPALTIIVDNIGPKTKCIVKLFVFSCKKTKSECTSITIYELWYIPIFSSCLETNFEFSHNLTKQHKRVRTFSTVCVACNIRHWYLTVMLVITWLEYTLQG